MGKDSFSNPLFQRGEFGKKVRPVEMQGRNKKRATPRSVLNTLPAGEPQRELSGQDLASTGELIDQIDSQASLFSPNAPELRISWSSFAKDIFCINAYPNGVTFSSHENITPTTISVDPSEGSVSANEVVDGAEAEKGGLGEGTFGPTQFHLRLKDTRDYQVPNGKYFLYKENYIQALRAQLAEQHRSGALGGSVVYFGTVSDPFHSFQKKFNITMSIFELLEQFQPGLIIVQSRSPMVISALPVFKLLAEKLVVAISIETRLEQVVMRYTPGQPKIHERLLAADGLRKQGIKVNAVVSPVLPYGDAYRDAWEFAEILDRYFDYVTLGGLATGNIADEVQLKSLPLSQKLVSDKNYRWLRPHSYRHLFSALSVIAPEKLRLPVQPAPKPAQLSLFAA